MKKEIIDGNTAVSRASYKLSDINFIYPITPSSTMAELCEEMSATEQKNIFDNVVSVTEMQSEAGAIGAVHGASLSGSLACTYTSSQGLLLMIPNMYKIAGEMLPVVIHVASRSVASHALNIFCDHSDVMSTRQTGFAMLCSASVQEAHDFAVASHLTSIKASIPFLHFFDGFRTSHEISNITTFEDDELKKLYPYDDLKKYRERILSPNNPLQFGTSEGSDVFFQGREKSNKQYLTLPDILQQTFDEMAKVSGRNYQPFEYFGSDKAKYIVVVMGSAFYTLKSFVEAQNDDEIGVLKVNLYRPFMAESFLQKLPKTVEKIAVLDRTKEQGSVGEPLFVDVTTCVNSNLKQKVEIIGGRYGLGGKEFDLSMARSVFDNLKQQNPKKSFTVGIDDDITHTSLDLHDFDISESLHTAIFYGFGSDGTVSSTKNISKIVGENSNMSIQSYSTYDSKKSGGITRSYLRFDNKKIERPYLIKNADYVVCNNLSFTHKYEVTGNLKKNGILILNTKYKTQKEFEDNLPDALLKDLSKKNITIYTIDANKISKQFAINEKISAIMQTTFFKISNIIDFDVAVEQTTKKIRSTLAKKGQKVVENNILAINEVNDCIYEIKPNENWKNLNSADVKNDYISTVLCLKGDSIPVSQVKTFGITETGSSKIEKRDISEKIPCWINKNCVQCGKCSMVCPHSVIRAKIISDSQLQSAPKSLKSSKCFYDKQNNFVLEVSPLDCTGCGLCESICPAKEKAIVLKDKAEVLQQQLDNYKFTNQFQSDVPNLPLSATKLQFMSPYFEFSGACAGCGETPYIKLLTQLFGKSLIIANATGCSSIYGGSNPTCPYTKDGNMQGPAWANSLFEDNAEFGFGIAKSVQQKRENFKLYVQKNINNLNEQLKPTMQKWLENFDNFEISNEIYLEIKKNKDILFGEQSKYIFEHLDCITKKSTWIVGGDGWAYDIGFGGLDHIMNSGENINILILDTELYSNTGGQMSKSSRINSVEKFASGGKKTNKKKLSLMAMTYQNVYVAQVCIGANQQQTIKAFTEAQEYDGVSVIIAYCPCINHGIEMDKNIERQIDAVKSGYLHLFRYNPALRLDEKNPLVIDSPKPTASLYDFVIKERRYANLLEKLGKENIKQIEKEQNDFYELLTKLTKL